MSPGHSARQPWADRDAIRAEVERLREEDDSDRERIEMMPDHPSHASRLATGQRVRLKKDPGVEGEIGAVREDDGVMYFVMWDDGVGQDRGLARPATIEGPLTIEAT